MSDIQSPKEVMESASPTVKKLLSEILKYEQEYLYIKNLASVKDKERELCDRIVKLIEKEVRT